MGMHLKRSLTNFTVKSLCKNVNYFSCPSDKRPCRTAGARGTANRERNMGHGTWGTGHGAQDSVAPVPMAFF